ncbi:uncharacterized protein V6R79_009153 [Siganus canaliculatus]
MEADGVPADVLLQTSWIPVLIGESRLLAKSWFGKTSYRVLLTDCRCVWEESMDAAAIQQRAQELNRRLRAPVQAFFSHLCQVVQPCLTGSEGRRDGEAQISLTPQDDGSIAMKLKSELAGLPFYWEFQCTPAPVTVVCAQLVRPLLAMSHLLQRQVEQLGTLLERKDAEIQDYRENGATLSRERLQTDAFHTETFREDFMAKTLPLLRSEPQNSLSFDGDLQHLYAAVVAHGNTRKRKLSEEDESASAEEPDVASSQGVLRQLHSDVTTLVEPRFQSSAGVSVRREAAEKKPNRPEGAAGAKMADRAAAQQSLTSHPVERPSSKPKKKKAAGLFR